MKFIVHWVLLSLVFAFLVMPQSLVYAQSSDEPFLNITSVNTEHFPDITVSLFGDNLRSNLGTLAIKLREGGVDQTIITSTLKPLGVRSAVVIAPSLFIPESSGGQLKIADEVVTAFGDFTTRGFFDSRVDQIAAYTLDPSTGVSQTLAAWTDQYTGVANALTSFRTPAGGDGSRPSLSSLLFFALNQLKAADLPPTTVRSILLFVGNPNEPDAAGVNIDELVQMFTQERAYVHIIVVKPEPSAAADNPLKHLAVATHGKYLESSQSLTQTLALLGDRLINERTQLVLTYRASKIPPTAIEASGVLPDNTTIGDRYEIPPLSFALKPIPITLLEPTSGAKITWPALDPNQAEADSKPETIHAKIKLGEGDQVPQRNVTSVEYTLSGPGLEGKTVSGAGAPNYEAVLEIAPPHEGVYQLKVTVVDQFGISSSIEPIEFQTVREVLPTPVPTPTPVVEPTVAATIAPSSAGLAANQPAAIGDGQQQYIDAEIATQATDSITIPYLNLQISRNIVWFLLVLSSLLFIYLLLPQSIHERVLGRFRKLPEQSGELQTPNRMGSTVNRPVNESAQIGIDTARKMAERRNFDINSDLQAKPADMRLPDSEPTRVTIKPETKYNPKDTVPSTHFQLPIIASLRYITSNESGRKGLPSKLQISAEATQVRIGRSHEWANLIIDDPRVSRRHATILIAKDSDGKHLRIQDEGGASGTWLNGVKLQASDKPLLQHEDIVSFGGEIAYQVEIVTKVAQTVPQPEEATSN